MKTNLLKKYSLSIILLFSIVINANSQWTNIPRVYGGTIANDGAVSFSIAGKGYVSAGSSTNAFYEYDTLSNSWSQAGNVPVGVGNAFAMSFVINEKAYIVGGDTGGVPIQTVWEFDPAASGNQWTQKNNFPGGIRDGGFGFTLNNFGYVGAGWDGTNMHNDIWKYDPAHDSWTQMVNSLPIGGLIFPTSFVIGNNGYIVTGGTLPSGVNETKKMWCLDGNTGAISVKSNFAGTARQAAFAFSNNINGFVGGGQAGYMTNYNDVWMYDTTNDQWSAAPTTPMIGAAWSSAFVIGNTAYAGLGAKFVGTSLTGDDQFYKFNMDLALEVNNLKTDFQQVNLYPNPATQNIYINGIKNVNAKYSIINSTGQIVRESFVTENGNIFIGDLPNGIYTVRLTEKNQCKNIRVIKE